MRWVLIAMVLASMLSFGCVSDVGEECDDVGSEGDCVDGAICTNDSSGTAFCRVICERDGMTVVECPADQSCSGISGVSSSSRKACQPGG